MARGNVSELPSLSYLHLVEISLLAINGTSLVAQTVMSLPAMYEIWVQFLRWEDPLEEEGMATHFCVTAWRIPMDRGAWWATVHGVAKSQT